MAITDKLAAVADAIRGKTGKAEKMTLDQMPGEIEGIQAGGGGDLKALVERTITEIEDDTIERVGANAFRGCTKLTTADFPNCKEVSTDAFNGCTSLTSFNFDSVAFIAAGSFSGAFTGAKLYIPNNPTLQYNAFAGCSMTELYAPNLKSTGIQAFQDCKSLVKAKLPALTVLETNAFGSCGALKVADFTALSIIYNAFAYCYELCALVIRNENEICTLGSSLYYTKIASGEGYVYVPRVFLDDADETKDYRMATNWATYSTQFRVLEDYTVDGTIWGELDESKI